MQCAAMNGKLDQGQAALLLDQAPNCERLAGIGKIFLEGCLGESDEWVTGDLGESQQSCEYHSFSDRERRASLEGGQFRVPWH